MERKRFQILYILLLMSALVLVCPPLSGQLLPSDEQKLLRGDVLISYREVPESSVAEVKAELFLDATVELVWSVLTDYKSYSWIFPDINRAELLSQKDNVALVRIRINNIWPYPNFEYTVKFTEDKSKLTISWKMEEGNLKTLFGSAALEKFPKDKDTTKLTYRLVSDPGWLGPLYSPLLANRQTVIDRMISLRKEVRERKRAIEQGDQGSEDIPRWRKTLFWWEKGKPNPVEESAPPAEGTSPEEKNPPTPSDGGGGG